MGVGEGGLGLELEGVVEFVAESLVLGRGVLGEDESEIELGELDEVMGF